MEKRKYTQRKRARQQELTRQKIVAATMELHETLGAARTTVSAVAEQAGVQRLTVYRHFPDEAALLDACTTRWLELNPLPAPDQWRDAVGARPRIAAALLAFHRYYARTQAMWTTSYRDVDQVPALAEKMALVEGYLDATAAGLTADLPDASRRRAEIVVRHGLRFATWRSLDAAGLGPEQAVALLDRWLDGLEGREPLA